MKSAKKKRKVEKKKAKKKTVSADFEEVIVTCANCGKKMKIIKLNRLNTEGMLCQSCGIGEAQFDTG